MDNILSTLKGEYARTLILILIPGALAFEPFAIMLYKHFSLHIENLNEYIGYATIAYVLASIFFGFIIQDLGSRLEIELDKRFCKKNDTEKEIFDKEFQTYLFNERNEDYIITHYYRSLLIRMKFELHSCVSIVILLIGSLLRIVIEKDFHIDYRNSIWFAVISFTIFMYLLYEAYKGVETLSYFRESINNRFNPTLTKEII